ncbi:DUF554 domain-containing protein [Veillonella caviae]|uniref:DUF554 domain-containing protein n=1 Tax=Veillonella caviae TaxID=248316 RepID=UPI0023F21780|nr:DUF554 domain-containing protein [Veillonella caviae]MCI6407202.1 DUF554 domain-containing protein [Veillonella caviae]MDY4745837.1 DUF554 domain-containing protein [Veillonella caviae]MDY6224724.1 DUF554 domain-containing protein [Veillonella caviae]
MPGLGTVINVALIIVGSVLGLAFRRGMKENLKQTLMMVSGVIVLLLGMSGAMQYMLVIVNGTLQTTGPLMMIISMVVGAVIGELIDFNRWIVRLGDWLKARTGNSGDPQFTNAFITASLTFTVGAMGVLGSIQDGLTGNYQTLLLKGILDGIIVMVMASSMGKGALFSFIPVGITQLMITYIANWAAPIMTQGAIDNLSYVGSILIFCVGIDLIWPGKIRIANLLPAIFIAMLLTFVF